MNNLIKKAKEVNEALKNYVASDDVDMTLCEKIFEYVQNIENLNEKEILELDKFIEENSFDEVHLANIYLVGLSDEILKKRLNRMRPFRASKTPSNIYEARGDIERLNKAKVDKEIKLNVKRKTYVKVA
ncbi:MAG: hypothetical protein IKF01_01005 [Bacilli bacterium]|nr:hypothetical protein [Bacilli bacterium]